MDFLSCHTAEARAMFVASLWRSTDARDSLLETVHKGGSSQVRLWWGASVPIRNGDVVRYFATPMGVALEDVLPPQEKKSQ